MVFKSSIINAIIRTIDDEILRPMSTMNQSIQIRRMQPTDIDACAAIMATTPLWQRYGVTHAGASLKISSGLESGADIFVAVASPDLSEKTIAIGFVLTIPHGAFNRSGYIQTLAVSVTERRAGIGRLLLEAAEAHLGQTAPDIFLLCSDFNLDAQRFYQRHGYQLVGRLADYVVVGVAELIYQKRLQTIAP